MGIIENVKDILKLIKQYDDADIYQKVVDLRDEIFKLREDNLSLKETIQSLIQEQSNSEKMVFEAPLYWKVDSDKKEGPYCQKCYDDDKKLIRLQDLKNGYWECCVCKNYFLNSSDMRIRKRPIPGSWMST